MQAGPSVPPPKESVVEPDLSQAFDDAAPAAPAPMIHPALRRKQARKRVDAKSRRTTVRTMKLVNASNPERPQLVQVPIEPSHNNRGNLSDPLAPIRYYLDKGFVQPYEYEGTIGDIDLKRIFCAVSNCWDSAEATSDPEGSERCPEHEKMYRSGEIRYAVSAKAAA